MVRPSPGSREPLHRHDDARVVLFLDGAYTERTFACATHCVSGEFVVRSAFYAHGGVTGERGAGYVRLAVSARAAGGFFQQHGWCARVGRIALDRRALPDLLADPLAGDAVLEQGGLRPLEQVRPTSSLSAIARALAGERCAPLAVLAEEHGMRPWTLSRAFNRAYGASPAAFRLQARLQRALRLLAETSASYAAVAAEAGFADQSHFNHALKRITGLAPAAMRRRLALA